MFRNIPIHELRLHPPFETGANPQFAKLCVSISQLGIMNPLIVTKDNVVIDGHWRYQAAKEVGIKEIPCHIIQHEGNQNGIRPHRWQEQSPTPLTYKD